MKYTIIADSSCDLKAEDFTSDKIHFVTVPLVITMGENHFIDEENLDTKELIAFMKANKDSPKTACPSPEAFAEEMRKHDYIICMTLTSKLSGTYNSARLAAETVLKENPNKKIFVLDTLSASAGMILMIRQLQELIDTEKYTFEEIVEKISLYKNTVKVRFLIQDFGNLIKTGRMSKMAGRIASILTIKVICGDNQEGEIKMYAKVFGMKKALVSLSECPADKVKEKGKDTPIAITHCHNQEGAVLLKNLLELKFGLTNVNIYRMRGVASFYANEKGLIIAY